MADPFSAAQLSLELFSIAVKAGQLVKQLRQAPDELLALSNELCDLRNIIDTVKSVLSTPRSPSQPELVGLAPQLFLASIRFEEVDGVIKRLGKLGQWGDKWDLSVWERMLWKKEKGRVIKLQSQLREVRQNISIALEANSVSAQLKVSVDLNDFVAETSKFQSLHAEAIGKNKHGIEEVRKSQQETNYLLEALVQAMPQLSVRSFTHETSSPGGTTLAEPIEEQPSWIEEHHRESSSESSDLTITTARRADEEEDTKNFVAIPIATDRIDPHACWSDCDCQCHKRQTFRTPHFLSDLAGCLSIGYNGSMLLKQECSLPSCHQRSTSSPQLMYFFPSWFLKRAISVSLISNAFTPHLSIKVRRVVPEMSQLFRLARYGDVAGVQELFSTQQASPDDVHVLGGWTALHFAVDHGSVELCRLLLEQGADANWEDGIGDTPIEYARRNVLMPRVCARAAEVYSVVISKAANLQERHFSRLHELILGLAKGSVQDEIKTHPSSVHARDIYGWTPLHWAARRGDTVNTALLLSHGADPFMKTLDDQCNPVHLAARGDSPGVIRLCLAHTYKGHRLDIDDWDHRARTALRIGASNNCVAAAALLIQSGSEVDNADRQNETTLLSCVYENAHDALPVVIKAGASPKAFTKSNNTLLHFAANESDLTTVALLTKARLRGVDIDKVNVDGFTARELAENRIGAPPGFVDAFDRLIASIIEAEASVASSERPGSRDSAYTNLSVVSSDAEREGQGETEGGLKVRSRSYASTVMSDAESFKSFEELIWSEAEVRGLRDMQEAEWEEREGGGLEMGFDKGMDKGKSKAKGKSKELRGRDHDDDNVVARETMPVSHVRDDDDEQPKEVQQQQEDDGTTTPSITDPIPSVLEPTTSNDSVQTIKAPTTSTSTPTSASTSKAKAEVHDYALD